MKKTITACANYDHEVQATIDIATPISPMEDLFYPELLIDGCVVDDDAPAAPNAPSAIRNAAKDYDVNSTVDPAIVKVQTADGTTIMVATLHKVRNFG